jgi:twitching motility protein PilT
VIAIYSDEENVNLSSEGNILSQFPIQQLSKNGILKSADIVVIDSSQTRFCEMALQLAEEGRSVLLTLPFWSIQMGLQRLADLCEGSELSRARRLSSTLQMALGLRLMSGIETAFQGAFELLLADTEMQKAMATMNFQEISFLMKSSAERTGMRSLNQSLFQLLMKRKIELKTAFEASPEPEELDSLLKKVGI